MSETKLYIAMINDRHSDPEPFVFSTAERAVEFARAKALEYAREPEGVEEEHIEGWLYFARYSVEGDDVWVLEKTLDAGDASVVGRPSVVAKRVED